MQCRGSMIFSKQQLLHFLFFVCRKTLFSEGAKVSEIHKYFLVRELQLILQFLFQSIDCLSFEKLPRSSFQVTMLTQVLLQRHSNLQMFMYKVKTTGPRNEGSNVDKNLFTYLDLFLVCLIKLQIALKMKIICDSDSIPLPDFKHNSCRVHFTHTKHNAKLGRNPPFLISSYLKMLAPVLKAVLTGRLRVIF